MFSDILNLEGHQNSCIGLKVTVILMNGWILPTGGANRYTKLENLACSQTVFLQFTFCIKHRFMKTLLLSSVATFIHNTG